LGYFDVRTIVGRLLAEHLHIHSGIGVVGGVLGAGILRIERRNLLPSQGVIGAMGALVGIGFDQFPGGKINLLLLAQKSLRDGLGVFLGEIRALGSFRQRVPEGVQ